MMDLERGIQVKHQVPKGGENRKIKWPSKYPTSIHLVPLPLFLQVQHQNFPTAHVGLEGWNLDNPGEILGLVRRVILNERRHRDDQKDDLQFQETADAFLPGSSPLTIAVVCNMSSLSLPPCYPCYRLVSLKDPQVTHLTYQTPITQGPPLHSLNLLFQSLLNKPYCPSQAAKQDILLFQTLFSSLCNYGPLPSMSSFGSCL